MYGEEMNPKSSGEANGASNPTQVERAAGIAREQASATADAFRRGEFMRDAAVDPGASADDRLIALLSYMTQIIIPLIMPVIVLMSESSKQRPFQRYHAVQTLALVLFFIGAAIAIALKTASA